MQNNQPQFGAMDVVWSKQGRAAASTVCLFACFISLARANAQEIQRIDAIGTYIDSCVSPKMAHLNFAGRREVTLRVSFRRDGSMIGMPMHTFSFPNVSGTEQQQFIRAVKQAFVACAPLPFSKQLGEAIAGRLHTFKFNLQSTKEIRI